MDRYIFISIIAALFNIVLSSVLPCMLKNTNIPFSENIKKVFSNNKELILTSSIIVGILVYLALITETQITQFSNLAKLNTRVVNDYAIIF